MKKFREPTGTVPPCMGWKEYVRISTKEYSELLENDVDHNEKVFHKFFERNPSFIPGAFQQTPNHSPVMSGLITEPRINNKYPEANRKFRKADFLWLAKHSRNLTPVFIEIEAPKKAIYRINYDDQRAELNHALNQIRDWQIHLDENREWFYKYYAVPEKLREKEMAFTPEFLLIYGRRTEIADDALRRKLLSGMERDDAKIMSFDRLQPSYECRNMLTLSVSNGVYSVVSIPPTFSFSYYDRNDFVKVKGFKEKVAQMEHTSEKRKNFLIERYDYWCDYVNNPAPIDLLNIMDNQYEE